MSLALRWVCDYALLGLWQRTVKGPALPAHDTDPSGTYPFSRSSIKCR